MFPNHIRNLMPYKPSNRVAESELDNWVLLDWNESTFPMPQCVVTAILKAVESGVGVRYSTSDHDEITSVIARSNMVPEQSVLLFNGSDSALRDVIAALGNDRPYVTFGPEYSQVDTYLQTIDARHVSIDIPDPFNFDVRQLLCELPRDAIVYLSNPNNPTGRYFSPQDIALIAESCFCLLLDEAYVEFAGDSCGRLLRSVENLFIFRTFSKLYGLAGLRIGYVMSSADNIYTISKIRNSKELNSFSLISAREILKIPSEFERRREIIISERQSFIEFVRGLKAEIVCYPSSANFIIIKTPHIKSLLSHLHGDRILIRDRSSIPGLEDCARVTIGDIREMDSLKRSMAAFFSKQRRVDAT
jgi:histidinol-phosphate aminotransferase